MTEVPWFWRGRQTLQVGLAEQQARYEALRRGEPAMALLLVEHEPVITLGRHGQEANVRRSREELARQGVAVVRLERGGDATYHGPGQLMIYPVVRVRSLRHVIDAIGEAIAHELCGAGIDARWRCNPAGVWVGERKIAACGMHVRHGIINHGFALNVDHDPEPWQWIVACGQGAAATSIAGEVAPALLEAPAVAAWAPRVGAAVTRAMAPWVSYGPRINPP
ncbi:MAG: lipoyl(octanoyl) transferase LipB [Myxococcales bacterium]|nr:lipoyl(octanoyl) transferase LipB [Myxococcales bacterium]